MGKARAEEEQSHEVDVQEQGEGESRGETSRPKISEAGRQYKHGEEAAERKIAERSSELSMDSINQNQPEENRRDLRGEEAVRKLKELVGKAETCFFRTASAISGSSGVRPMSVQQADDAGMLWFLSAADSHKNAEIECDPSVHLYFQGSKHSDFLMLSGRASISRDKAKIEELWEPIVKTWFTEGVNDPRITVIKVTPTSGYYWDTKHGIAVAGVKMLVGAAIGKTLDDSIEGTLQFPG